MKPTSLRYPILIAFLIYSFHLISATDEANVTIDGLNYYLDIDSRTAIVDNGNTCFGELSIPSEVSYEGQTFVVKSMVFNAFDDCSGLTKVVMPSTMEYITHHVLNGMNGMVPSYYMNPFLGCTALESIEVDESNPSMKSIDGVLFSQDGVGRYDYKMDTFYGTGLYCYPEGKQQENYTIPDGVEWIGGEAFRQNQYLTTLTMPSSMKHICESAFAGCSKLKDVCCEAEDVPVVMESAFRDTPLASATLHVPEGSVEKYQRTSPWKDFGSIVAIEEIAQVYFPEGTKWTEIRLDTLKYDSWYSKVGDEWMPNFEAIEYRVEGDYTEKWGETYKCVYSNAPEWMSTPLLIKETDSEVSVSLIYDKESKGVLWNAQAYQFDWSVGKGLYYQDIEESNSTGIVPYYFFYGVIDEIKEGYFGGVRPLKYVDLDGKAATLEFGYCIDTRGGRIIQGIGITEWNDGECLFGPPNPYFAMTGSYNDRHYRSMLVHFERDGEVLYDVWPEKPVAIEPVAFTSGQMATIVLPMEPDASKGKYYRLDRVEGNEIVFEQELQPRAHVPYIIVPSEDFGIELGAMELEGLRCDTASVEGISFIGTFQKEEVESQEGFYIELIDTTPDCNLSPSGEAGRDVYTIGALHAYLLVHWDDPYHPGGTKAPAEKMEIVLKDNPDSIEIVNSKSSNSKCYDLSGKPVNRKSSNSKFPRGIYIEGGKVKIY